MDCVGEIQRKGWYICVDLIYVLCKLCIIFLFNNIFFENIFFEDLKLRYGCDIYKILLWLKILLKFWKNEMNIFINDVIDIFILSINGILNLLFIDYIVNEKFIS